MKEKQEKSIETPEEKVSTASISSAIPDIVKALSDLSREEQARALEAVATIIGTASLSGNSVKRASNADDQTEESKYNRKVKNWLDKHNIDKDDLEKVFFEDGDIIAQDVPGSTNSKMTRNCYVLTGLSSFISDGEGKFDDSHARNICKSFGCYDPTNHSTYLKNTSYFTGDKKKGWTLTKPGLKKGASLVDEIIEQT